MVRFSSVRQGLRAFGVFWAGKMAAVSTLAFLSAVLGRTVIDRGGRILGFNLRWALDGCLILTGIHLLIGTAFRGKRRTAVCSKCGASCRNGTGSNGGKKIWLLMAMGAAYGLTPCAPMILFLLITAVSPPLQAVALGLVFSLANLVSPLLLYISLAGFVSQKLQQEIPGLLRIFQITVFSSFIIAGIISLAGHL
jgi:sulfite exporter TauE/SafE